MEMLLSATLGELAKRSISFLIDKCSKQATESKEERLGQMLLRVRVTVEEAEGRCISNQAMLQRLNMMKQELYRGCHALDTFRCRAHKEENGNDHQVSRPLFLSKFNPAKRVCIASSSRHGTKALEQVLDSIEMIITGMSEFVVYLTNCPPMHRQPYSMYMFLENCMFGRQTEMEMVISFLLQREPPGKGNHLGVLPIVGPSKTGKSTLVEHVCCDERVRDQFSQIVFFNENGFGNEQVCNLRDGGIIKHKSSALRDERLLVVIELDTDVDEGEWKRLYSASQRCFPRGSKIIITSRSDKVTNFGTTQAVSLFLSREAYWYFFKVLVFGSSDPEEQPKLASMAMEIFEEYFDQYKIFQEFSGPFMDANNIARLLRAKFDMRHWRRVLACIRENKNKNFLFNTCPGDSGMKGQPIYLERIAKSTQYCRISYHDQMGSAQKAVPKITLHEVILGSITVHGKFEIVFFKSHLPPYHNYIYSCEVCHTYMTRRRKLCQKRKI